jgi:glycosyltransferase involved in cell wall biosynthesis
MESMDVLCFSHLRWNFVFQRPQHLMTRCAVERRVYFFEEPMLDARKPSLETYVDGGVVVVVPHLPPGTGQADRAVVVRGLLLELIGSQHISNPLLWYYTPMALEYSRGVRHSGIVFDCMDELSAFAGAPAALVALERELLAMASVVFTGGQSLFQAKRDKHPRVHAFPSSVDIGHFARARTPQSDPQDQAGIPRPRLGFYGVIDERMDLDLVGEVARLREDWHQVILGPCVKIDEATLPRRNNIHYLGMKKYDDLPRYLAGWDVAILPFARNDSTRFISPTKTPEYLAAGRPVVSTSIADVVRPYGHRGLAGIADSPTDFIAQIELAMHTDHSDWLPRVDQFLAGLSWDRTWQSMRALVDEATARPGRPDPRSERRAHPRLVPAPSPS